MQKETSAGIDPTFNITYAKITNVTIHRLMVLLTPVIIVTTGILALLIAGWNSSQIEPLLQWTAEKEGRAIYARVIHESTLSPTIILQNPELLEVAISEDKEIFAVAIMQGDQMIASFSKRADIIIAVADLPKETGARVINNEMSIYRRFFGPGSGSGPGSRQGSGLGGKGSGDERGNQHNGKGPRWMRNESGEAPEGNDMPLRFSIIFAFSGPDKELVIPLIYQKFLWPIVWLFLTTLWVIILWMQKHSTKLQAERQKEAHLAAIGKMSARLAHEIKNPLGAIRGMAQLLQKRLKESNELSMVKTIEQETFRLDDLTRSILDYSKPAECSVIPLNPIAIVNSSIDLFKQQNTQAKIDCKTPETNLICSGDENAIRQIMLNLLKNASDAAGNDQKITIEIIADNDNAKIRVINPGSALSRQMIADAFEPFVSTKTHGYGLGLPISKRLAEMQGGSLSLKNLSPNMIVAELTLKLDKNQ